MSAPRISVIIPAFNEQEGIVSVLRDIAVKSPEAGAWRAAKGMPPFFVIDF